MRILKCGILYVFLGISVMFSNAMVVQGQEELGTVEGVVRGSTGPYPNAKVVVNCLLLASYEGEDITDANGHFIVSGIPVGGEVEVRVFDSEDKLIGNASALLNQTNTSITVNVDILN